MRVASPVSDRGIRETRRRSSRSRPERARPRRRVARSSRRARHSCRRPARDRSCAGDRTRPPAAALPCQPLSADPLRARRIAGAATAANFSADARTKRSKKVYAATAARVQATQCVERRKGLAGGECSPRAVRDDQLVPVTSSDVDRLIDVSDRCASRCRRRAPLARRPGACACCAPRGAGCGRDRDAIPSDS